MDTLFVEPKFMVKSSEESEEPDMPLLEQFGHTLELEQAYRETLEAYHAKVAAKKSLEIKNEKLEVEARQLQNLNKQVAEMTADYRKNIDILKNGSAENAGTKNAGTENAMVNAEDKSDGNTAKK